MSDVFWEFMWKEIIGLVVAVGTGVLLGTFWLPACSEPLFNPLCTKNLLPQDVHPPGQQLIFFIGGLKNEVIGKFILNLIADSIASLIHDIFRGSFDSHYGFCQ